MFVCYYRYVCVGIELRSNVEVQRVNSSKQQLAVLGCSGVDRFTCRYVFDRARLARAAVQNGNLLVFELYL